MFYFIVVAYKNQSDECRSEWRKNILKKCAEIPAHVVEEFGESGDSPHLNIVIDNKDKNGKNFREKIKRTFPVLYPPPTTEEWGICLKGKGIRDFRNLGNVLEGYLTKETNCNILQDNLLSQEGYESLKKQHQEFVKIPEVKYSIKSISKLGLFNLVVQIYNEEYYDESEFNKNIYKEIIKKISKSYAILDMVVVVKLYAGIESYIHDKATYIEDYMDMHLGDLHSRYD